MNFKSIFEEKCRFDTTVHILGGLGPLCQSLYTPEKPNFRYFLHRQSEMDLPYASHKGANSYSLLMISFALALILAPSCSSISSFRPLLTASALAGSVFSRVLALEVKLL
jgi:hypothetical protein